MTCARRILPRRSGSRCSNTIRTAAANPVGPRPRRAARLAPSAGLAASPPAGGGSTAPTRLPALRIWPNSLFGRPGSGSPGDCSPVLCRTMTAPADRTLVGPPGAAGSASAGQIPARSRISCGASRTWFRAGRPDACFSGLPPSRQGSAAVDSHRDSDEP